MKTYNERLNEIAEEMAKAKTPKIYEMKLSQSQRDSLIASYLPLARIAMKHMAKTYEGGYLKALDYAINARDIPPTIKEQLQSLGLIEPQTT